MTTDMSREAVEAAADRLERALDPDKRGGWSRLMSRGEEGDEIADFRTVIAGARARDKLAAKLDAVKALCEKESGEIRTRYEPEGPYTGYANACDDVLAILADTETREEGDL